MINSTISDYKVYNIFKIKNNKYGFRVKLIFLNNSSTIKQHSGFATKKEAEQFRNQIISELVTGTYIFKNNIKLDEYLVNWLENIMKNHITYNTYLTYRNAIHNHINPEIGNLNIGNISKDIIRNFYEVVYLKSKKIASICKTILNTSFKNAVREDLLTSNPAENVKLPKSTTIIDYPRTKIIDTSKVLNLEQIKVLITASKSTPIYLQVLFSVLMGLRRSEINGLKYSDVDFVHQKLYVQRQLGKLPPGDSENGNIKFGDITKQEIPLKTKSSRRVLEIPDIVFEAILEERKLYEKRRNRRKKEFRDLNYICCSTYGRPRSKGFHRSYFIKLLEENNLPNIRFHDLRHSYSTLLTKNNFNLKAISKTLGHSREIITSDVYVDNYEIIENLTEEIADYINEVLPPDSLKDDLNNIDNAVIINEISPDEIISEFID